MQELKLRLPTVTAIEKCGKALKPKVQSGFISSEKMYHEFMQKCTDGLTKAGY